MGLWVLFECIAAVCGGAWFACRIVERAIDRNERRLERLERNLAEGWPRGDRDEDDLRVMRAKVIDTAARDINQAYNEGYEQALADMCDPKALPAAKIHKISKLRS